MVELKPSKLMTRVRFPSPAPILSLCADNSGNKCSQGAESGKNNSSCSSVVEHSLGKGEATCSIHVKSTKISRSYKVLSFRNLVVISN